MTLAPWRKIHSTEAVVATKNQQLRMISLWNISCFAVANFDSQMVCLYMSLYHCISLCPYPDSQRCACTFSTVPCPAHNSHWLIPQLWSGWHPPRGAWVDPGSGRATLGLRVRNSVVNPSSPGSFWSPSGPKTWNTTDPKPKELLFLRQSNRTWVSGGAPLLLELLDAVMKP